MAIANKDQVFNKICEHIEKGNSLRSALRLPNMPDMATFQNWIDNEQIKLNQYARACNLREDHIFDEILEIADHSEEDHTPFTGGNVIQRDKLRTDARKWVLSRMNPKKFGDKTDLTTNGNDLNVQPSNIVIVNSVPEMKEIEG